MASAGLSLTVLRVRLWFNAISLFMDFFFSKVQYVVQAQHGNGMIQGSSITTMLT